jgi:uncharacterized protein
MMSAVVYDPNSPLNEDGLRKNSPDAIFTYSGRFIRPLDPNPNDIFIEDIAHALANQCRWTGHVSRFLSVAEHSVHVSQLVPKELQLTALLHDASEAYLADLARPIKKAPGLGEIYLEIEAKLSAVIAIRFGITDDPLSHAEVKLADERVLWSEAKALLPRLGQEMPDPGEDCPTPKNWTPLIAKQVFLDFYKAYGGT